MANPVSEEFERLHHQPRQSVAQNDDDDIFQKENEEDHSAQPEKQNFLF